MGVMVFFWHLGLMPKMIQRCPRTRFFFGGGSNSFKMPRSFCRNIRLHNFKMKIAFRGSF